jgi:hypothetical protein
MKRNRVADAVVLALKGKTEYALKLDMGIFIRLIRFPFRGGTIKQKTAKRRGFVTQATPNKAVCWCVPSCHKRP